MEVLSESAPYISKRGRLAWREKTLLREPEEGNVITLFCIRGCNFPTVRIGKRSLRGGEPGLQMFQDGLKKAEQISASPEITAAGE